jgi:Ca2+-binding EF-hand superfamily protein
MTEVGIWAEFQKRISAFAQDALGMSPSAAFSLIGMTAFERELMQRLNKAGVNITAKLNPLQLRQVQAKVSTAQRKSAAADESSLPPLKKMAGEQTSKSLDAASVGARSLRQTVSARAHSERMRPGVLNVNKETIKEWLKEPAIDPEKRLTITHFQNQQWKTLYDAKHDPSRIKQQHMERLAAAGVRKVPAQTLTIAGPLTAHSKNKSSKGKGDTAGIPSQLLEKETAAQFQERVERDRQEKIRKKLLCKRLRNSLQSKFNKTQTLPIDLFKAFQKYDADKSGAIDFDEFQQVCDFAGLGKGILTQEEIRVLFEQADCDNGGTVDFAEFLKVVVGNLVSL